MLSNGLRCRQRTLIFLLLGFCAQLFNPAIAARTVQGKYHPGHYVALNRSGYQAQMTNAIKPGVAGVQQRYYWKELEPSYGVYDFSAIEADLAEASSHGVQLVVMIVDKTFNSDKPLPAYAQQSSYMAANRSGGYSALRWKSNVVGRFTSLMQAIGKKFDAHPAFEGVAIQETSLGLSNSVLDANGYTPEKYRDALIDVLLSAASSMPNSRVFWYMNFLARNQGYLADIARAVAPAGVIMGGPDILPDDSDLKNVYPLYDQFQGVLPLFCSVQPNSYKHIHAQSGYSTKYWTMQQLFNFGRDKLHLNYIFWSNVTKPAPSDSYTIVNAYPVIAKNPVFNAIWSGAGQDSDGDGLTDYKEKTIGTDPYKKDTDGEGLADGREVSLGTNPLKRDTDAGGVDDKTEVDTGTNPLKGWDDKVVSKDSDGDGLTDADEKALGTAPYNADTDGDGLGDGKEVQLYNTDPLKRDSDSDYLGDGNEITRGTSPLKKDTDWDGLLDGREVTLGTNPLKKDTDGGGTDDKTEVGRGTNPLKAWDD